MTISKTALACAVLALCLVGAVIANVLVYSWLETAQGRLLTEQTAHNATRSDYARDTALWVLDQRAANGTILGLQRQVNATLASKAVSLNATISRAAIFSSAAVQAAKPNEVVDDQTSRAAVRHLNNAYRRAARL